LDTGEVYIPFGDGRRVCLVELVDAMIRNVLGDEGSDEVRTTTFSSLQLARSGLPQYRSFFETVAVASVVTISATTKLNSSQTVNSRASLT